MYRQHKLNSVAYWVEGEDMDLEEEYEVNLRVVRGCGPNTFYVCMKFWKN